MSDARGRGKGRRLGSGVRGGLGEHVQGGWPWAGGRTCFIREQGKEEKVAGESGRFWDAEERRPG